MKSVDLFSMLNTLPDAWIQEAEGTMARQKSGRGRKTIRFLLIAALVACLGATAYAAIARNLNWTPEQQKALQEYALNIALLKEKIEWKDLTEFLTVWQEEYNSQAASLEGKDKLFQLSLLISNLDIQLDMLRVTKGWQQLSEDVSKQVALPAELEIIQQAVAAI